MAFFSCLFMAIFMMLIDGSFRPLNEAAIRSTFEVAWACAWLGPGVFAASSTLVLTLLLALVPWNALECLGAWGTLI